MSVWRLLEGGEGRAGHEPEDMMMVVWGIGYIVRDVDDRCEDKSREGDFIFMREHDGL
jgi:hypothetical protein